MARYDAKQVCLNGHHITDKAYTGDFARDYCEDCGAETITECPECGEKIKGKNLNSTVAAIGFGATVPEHCEECGRPFPWSENEELDEENSGDWDNTAENIIERVCQQFSTVAYHLQHKQRYSDRNGLEIQDEYDVQDLLNAILRVHFEDVRPEEGTPSHAGSSSRIDFLLKNEKIGIEVKMTRNGLNEAELGEELSTDKERYKSHPDCNHLICFIYDPERMLTNPAVLEDLNTEGDEFSLKVIISPSR